MSYDSLEVGVCWAGMDLAYFRLAKNHTSEFTFSGVMSIIIDKQTLAAFFFSWSGVFLGVCGEEVGLLRSTGWWEEAIGFERFFFWCSGQLY